MKPVVGRSWLIFIETGLAPSQTRRAASLPCDPTLPEAPNPALGTGTGSQAEISLPVLESFPEKPLSSLVGEQFRVAARISVVEWARELVGRHLDAALAGRVHNGENESPADCV